MRDGLTALGYVEGKTVTIESRHGHGRSDELASITRDLVRLKIDAIVAVNTAAAQAAKDATSTIPIVITRVADPVTTGLVRSLSHPGGNVTGLSFQTEELGGKRLDLLKQAVPGVTSVALLWYGGNPGSSLIARQIEQGGVSLDIRIWKLAVQRPTEIADAIESAARHRVGALIVVDDAFVTSHRAEILQVAAKRSLPVMAQFAPFVEMGALLAYGPSEQDMYRRAASYLDRIIKGAKPGDLPIERPTKFELIVNLKTAKLLGLTMSQSLLLRADRVIE